MTEEEAKTKWCPFVRVINGKIFDDSKTSHHANGQPSYNRITDDGKFAYPNPGAHCLGSACMAWRWERDRKDDEDRPYRHSHGYCGLASRP